VISPTDIRAIALAAETAEQYWLVTVGITLYKSGQGLCQSPHNNSVDQDGVGGLQVPFMGKLGIPTHTKLRSITN